MNRTMLKVVRIELKNKIVILCIMFGFWLLVIGAVAMVAAIEGSLGAEVSDWEMVALGSMMAIGIILAESYITFRDFGDRYVLAVYMGRKKRDILIAHLLAEAVFNIVSFALAYVLYQAELRIYDKIGFVKYEFSLDGFFDIKLLLCLVVILSVLNMFAGALYLWKAWVPWLVWIAGCILIGRIGSLVHKMMNQSGAFRELVNWFWELPLAADVGMVLLVAIVMGMAARRILYSRNL